MKKKIAVQVLLLSSQHPCEVGKHYELYFIV